MGRELARHFTLFAATFGETRCLKAKRVVTGFLLRHHTIKVLSEKFREFVKSGYQLQGAIRRAKSNSAFRFAWLAVKVAKEVRYLQWFYEKKLKAAKAAKPQKEFNSILNKLHNLEEEGQGQPGQGPEGRQKISLYIDRMRAEYLLDYSIWYYVRLVVKEETLREEATGAKANVYQNPAFTQLIHLKKRLFSRLKDWRIATMKLDE